MKKKLLKRLLLIFSIVFIVNITLLYPLFIDSSLHLWRIIIYDRTGAILTHKWLKDWYFKTYSWSLEVSSAFIKELIQKEDKRFLNHFGIDIIAKIRALKTNIENNKILSGWSTITEQYIKNKYFRDKKRTYLQKIRESYIAFFYDLTHSKADVLKNYLDTIYFWNQIYGIAGSMEIYFQKQNINDLDEDEIHILLALIKNPSKITNLPKRPNIDLYPHVTQRLLEENKDQTEVVIFSTLSKDLQDYSFNLINKTINELKNKNVTNASLISFNPYTLEVYAYHWSKNFYDTSIDWQVDVISKKRQLWSTFKPFLYLLALENWAEIDDLILDIESKYNIEQNNYFYTQNYSLKQYWLIRLKKALWNSLNNASVRLGFELWLEKVYNFYKKYWFKLDFDPKYYWFWLVLWNASITLEELVLSYADLLPDLDIDIKKELIFDIKNTKNRQKTSIDTNKYLLYNILSNPDNRDVSFWVNSVLNTPIYLAVKTWTSSNFRDNSLIWYHPSMVVWIWVWNNDNSSMMWVTWITGAWYIYNQFIKESIQTWFIQDIVFQKPQILEDYFYCLDKNCFMQERSFSKQKHHQTRWKDEYYHKNDIFWKIEDEEREVLKSLWFFLQEN